MSLGPSANGAPGKSAAGSSGDGARGSSAAAGPWGQAVLSLGSNLGDRARHLSTAVDLLGRLARVVAVSGVYAAPPWGDTDQPEYLNCVLVVAAAASGRDDWLHLIRAVERAAGRRRDPARPYGPRTLDVDVVVRYAADGSPVVSDHPDLTVPHPRAHLRAFVLRPWSDIEPDAALPGLGPVAELLAARDVARDDRALRACPEFVLAPPGSTCGAAASVAGTPR